MTDVAVFFGGQSFRAANRHIQRFLFDFQV